jgi:hypothetical protein
MGIAHHWTRVVAAFLACTFCAASAAAGQISLTGNLAADDDLVTIDFNVSAAGPVTLRTWSFGGGVDALGNPVAPGGFAPVLSLFSGAGSQDLLAVDYADLSGTCDARVSDPASGFCWDAVISTILTPGAYILTLTEDDNTPNGPSFADGFRQSGQGDFTGPEFLGAPGAFILVDGSQRSPAWELDLIGVDLPGQDTPEPSGAAAIFLALAWAFVKRRRA